MGKGISIIKNKRSSLNSIDQFIITSDSLGEINVEFSIKETDNKYVWDVTKTLDIYYKGQFRSFKKNTCGYHKTGKLIGGKVQTLYPGQPKLDEEVLDFLKEHLPRKIAYLLPKKQ